MAVPVHIVLIDTTGTIRLSRMQKVAAAIEHQVKHDLGKFYDVDAHIAALRHGEQLPNKTWPVHIVPDVRGGGGFHSDQDGAPFAKVCIGHRYNGQLFIRGQRGIPPAMLKGFNECFEFCLRVDVFRIDDPYNADQIGRAHV